MRWAVGALSLAVLAVLGATWFGLERTDATERADASARSAAGPTPRDPGWRHPIAPAAGPIPVATRAGVAARGADPTPPRPTHAEMLRRLEHEVATEPVDTAWATETERRMANAFASETFAGSRLVRAVCRRTLCRAHVAHDSLDAKEQFLSRLPFTDPFRGEAMIEHPDGDPNAETIVYLARAGA